MPKLRFPEFLDAEEWEIKEFSKYIVLYRGSSPRPIQNYLSSDSSGVNWIKIGDTKSAKNFVISQVEEKITPDGAKKSRKVNIGELILANSMSYGKTYLLAIDGCIYDGWFVLRNHEKYFDKQFLLQLLNSEYMQNQYERFSAGGIVQNISSDIVYKTVLPHTSLKEQKKIADCLSSIADRITAETQKLDTLKAHKKGLMQQLFPAEGETLPKLRFPEFQDSGEWDIKPLGSKAIKVGSGITPNGGEKNYKSEGRPFIRSQNIGWGCLLLDDVVFIDDVTHSTFSATEINDGDVFLNITGASIGRSAVADFRVKCGNVNQHVCIIRTEKFELNPFYLNQYLLSQYGQKQIDSFQSGGNRQGLNFAQIRSFSLPLPLIEEQQKIADCLTSIDEAIAAQSKAIDLLKLHKKGLMQQLFPSVEEVRG
ncbi:MAG: restriction endonuclease subunit S [Cyanobacteria bacterium]|nr:restriction endonuclease subunit S [Cyanobacteriota bacterium]